MPDLPLVSGRRGSANSVLGWNSYSGKANTEFLTRKSVIDSFLNPRAMANANVDAPAMPIELPAESPAWIENLIRAARGLTRNIGVRNWYRWARIKTPYKKVDPPRVCRFWSKSYPRLKW
jgi:hypothetical protein